MTDQFSMFPRTTSKDTSASTSSPGSEDGTTPSTSPDGKDRCGPDHVHVSRSVRQESDAALKMNGTYGLHSSVSLNNVSHQSSSVSRFPVPMCSDLTMKKCTQCGLWKPAWQYRKYSGRSRFGRRPLCKVCQRQYEKQWRSQSTEYRRTQRKKRAEKNKVYSREYRATNRAKYLVAECRRRSAKKSWEFDLDQHVEELQARMDTGLCELTGYPLDLSAGSGRPFNTPSIDRIEPSKGYVYSNVRVICFAANAMLGNWGEEAALKVARSWLKKVEA